MANNNVILRFSEVSFEYEPSTTVLDEASFSVRAGSRIALMGQNGAGKSSLFNMITGVLEPTEGKIFKTPLDATIAIAYQVMPDFALTLSIREYFATAFKDKRYNLDKLIEEVFDIVHLALPLETVIKDCSGGQQARLLLAYALIQQPDILLLDEPTNNLDQYGIEHLTGFLMMYEKTCLVISHDADFLNAFCDGVLYLDAATHKVEQYSGNYSDVMEEITKRIERENLQNARMQMQIKEKRAQAEVFAHKGGKLRGVAKRMRQAAEAAEEQIVSVRQEDRTIRPFTLPAQIFDASFNGRIVEFRGVAVMQGGSVVEKKLDLIVRKHTHVRMTGPNGLGKSTLLEKIAQRASEYVTVAPEAVIGYYKQDFSNLDGDRIAYDVLQEAMNIPNEHVLRSTAAGFLLNRDLLASPIRALSEGQKGLLSFCRLVLLQPGLLILDEPTNHINFRHLPVIAQALDCYAGAFVLVSHLPSFVASVRIDEVVDLEKLPLQ